jgi:tetratricopeptide (TPR) repeat protein
MAVHPFTLCGRPSQAINWRATVVALLAFAAVCGASRGILAQSTEGAESRLALSESAVWSLAESLLAEGEYYRAVTEYKRLLHYFPAGPHIAQAQQHIALALLLGGEPRQAVSYVDSQLGAATPPAQRDRWLLLRALGWMDLDADQPMPLRKPNLEQARADLAAVSSTAPEHERIAGFLAALDAPPDLPHKSPGFAGALSAIVPGAGSVYVGRYSEGALAFFVNALLISGTVTAFQEHQDGLGVGLGVLAIAFYGGSIYAAASGAHKFNDRTEAAYLDEQRVRFGLILERGKIGAAFQSSF